MCGRLFESFLMIYFCHFSGVMGRTKRVSQNMCSTSTADVTQKKRKKSVALQDMTCSVDNTVINSTDFNCGQLLYQRKRRSKGIFV